jgi:hypothetical protein
VKSIAAVLDEGTGWADMAINRHTVVYSPQSSHRAGRARATLPLATPCKTHRAADTGLFAIGGSAPVTLHIPSVGLLRSASQFYSVLRVASPLVGSTAGRRAAGREVRRSMR